MWSVSPVLNYDLVVYLRLWSKSIYVVHIARWMSQINALLITFILTNREYYTQWCLQGSRTRMYMLSCTVLHTNSFLLSWSSFPEHAATSKCIILQFNLLEWKASGNSLYIACSCIAFGHFRCLSAHHGRIWRWSIRMYAVMVQSCIGHQERKAVAHACPESIHWTLMNQATIALCSWTSSVFWSTDRLRRAIPMRAYEILDHVDCVSI